MQKWEYEVIKIEDEARKIVEGLPKGQDLEEFLEDGEAARALVRHILDDLGGHGWELVLMEHDTLIFKRPKQ